ncbi:hypothetical protein MMC17_009100 [Xylographa soralifera]|nr:hypothetical protein [Xylographa soralifera]
MLEQFQDVSYLQILAAMFFSFSIFIVVAVIRRIYFSPISDIPGPFIARFSILWQLWVTATGQAGPAIVALHKKHGKFVRIAYNEVSVCDSEGSPTVLKRNIDKGSWYEITALPDSRLQNQMSITSATDCTRLFKGLAGGYKLSNILQAEPFIDDCISLFRRRIDNLSATSQPVDFSIWFTFLFFDIVGETTFSKRFGFLDEGRDVGDAIKNQWFLTAYLALMGYFPWAHNWLLANPLIEYLHLQPAMHVFDTTKAAIAARATNFKAHPDMVEQWMRANKEHPERFSKDDILAAGVVTVGAAADTSGAALQAFVYFLMRDPEMLALLRKEIDTADLAPIPTYESVRNLPMLQACIKEALRIHCPTSLGLTRVSPPGGITICSRLFPAGTVLSVNQWAVHSLPIFGPDAERFNPRRWLTPAPPGTPFPSKEALTTPTYPPGPHDSPHLRLMHECLLPFSAGYNACPGQHLARLEISKVAAVMVRDYEIAQVQEGREWKWRSHFAVVPWGWDCWVKTRRRG